jgi:hypothetical protein
MPRGGARVGAGRKPKPRAAVVLGMDGVRREFGGLSAADGAPVDQEVALRVPPDDLPKAQQAFWSAWAPLALSKQTLVPEHVPGFRTLCRVAWVASVMEQRLAKVGPASAEAESLLNRYVKVEQRLDAMMQRFGLTGMGKAATSPNRRQRPGPVQNRFAFLLPAVQQ